MDYFNYGWSVVKKDIVAWVILYFVFALASQVFIGFLLMPQLIRVVRKSMAEGTAPAIGDYFNFDNISNDAITMIILMVAYMIAAVLCYLPIFAAVPLLFWTQHLAAENQFEPMDNLKASFAHAKENFGSIFGTIFVVGLVCMLITMVTCGLGALVMVPVMWVAWEKFYQDNRADIFAAAQAAGIPSRA